MTDLKPCPYCGGTELKIADSPYQVWCLNPGCHNRGPKLNGNPTKELAIAVWNYRYPSPAVGVDLSGVTWTNSGLLERSRARFDELKHKGWDWSSFYNGFLEGASGAFEYASQGSLHRPIGEEVRHDQLRTGDLQAVHHGSQERDNGTNEGDLQGLPEKAVDLQAIQPKGVEIPTVEEMHKVFWDGYYGDNGYCHPVSFESDEGTPVNHGLHAVHTFLVERMGKGAVL